MPNLVEIVMFEIPTKITLHLLDCVGLCVTVIIILLNRKRSHLARIVVIVIRNYELRLEEVRLPFAPERLTSGTNAREVTSV